MRLSDLELNYNEKVLRDATFEYFGLLNYENVPGIMLSFFGNKAFISHLKNRHIGCVICREDLVEYLPDHIRGIIISDNPLFSFWKLHEKYGRTGKHDFKTVIGNNSHISDKAAISENGVIIGDNVTIEEFVSVKEGTRIEDNVIIRSGTVLGGSCLELSRQDDLIFAASLYGGLIIEKNVVICQNNTIIRGTFEWLDAIIGSGTKIDSNNFISHNVIIGKNSTITSGVIINGDVTVGDEVWMSPGVNITNSVSIGDRSNIMLGSKVSHSIDKDSAIVDGKIYSNKLLNAVRKMH